MPKRNPKSIEETPAQDNLAVYSEPIPDTARVFEPVTLADGEPYTLVIKDGEAAVVPVESVCVPAFLEPLYNALITITYNGKRVTSMGRDHGIFRLWLEDGTLAAVTHGQRLTVINGSVVQSVESELYPDIDDSLNGVPIDDSALFPEFESPADGEAAG